MGLFACVGPVVACAEMNNALEQGKAMLNAPAGANSTGGPSGSAGPSGGQGAPASGGSGSQTYCCVGPNEQNQTFYDCETAENAVKCMGNPFDISPCAQKCPPDDAKCPQKCMEDHGPNPKRGNCKADPSRNAECKKK